MALHNIIIPYRSRPKALRSFLNSLPVSDSVVIRIVDLGSSQEETKGIVAGFMHKVEHVWLHHTGTFSRSMALNYGLKLSTSEFITIFDVDCLFKSNPIPDITSFRDHQNKLSWRLIPLDPNTSQKIMDDPTEFNRLDVSGIRNQVHEKIDDVVVGTSHLTISRKLILDCGGYDEEFIGYGFEDHELNRRLLKAGVQTTMNTEIPIYHLTHKYEPNWRSPETDSKNKMLYLKKSI